jgi:uncharacterized protein YukE
MGGYGASASNVVFEYEQALLAARQLYALADALSTKHETRVGEAALVVDGWEGGHRDTFDSKMATEHGDMEAIRQALRDLAAKFASEWAAARGEQDRINQARWVQQQKDDDSWAEDGVEWITGEDDYGPPPEDPEPPPPPDFMPTRDPIHPEFEYA